MEKHLDAVEAEEQILRQTPNVMQTFGYNSLEAIVSDRIIFIPVGR